MINKNIWIVEDNRDLSGLLKEYLEQSDFAVKQIFRGDELIPQMRSRPPDLILLDLMLPGADGVTLCREIRTFSAVPIIMVTAKVEEIDRLLGLEIGADDYVCKPFSPREVVARVKAVLRRGGEEPHEAAIHIGPLLLKPETHSITVAGKDLKVTQSEFSLLHAFMAHPGKVFSRDELIAKIQGRTYEGYDRNIDWHIKNLRKKLIAAQPGLEPIESVYGVGYKFILEG
ncbi:response regulator [Desulfatibacillum aliphaticivorans]|nr:response regulator [Desulfatibacillum aliphaticivorans]